MDIHPLILESGVILVDTKIIGKTEPHFVRMILDTGATYTMISPDILVDAGYEPSRDMIRRPITTASGVEHCSFLKIKALTSLGVTIKNIEVCAHPLPPNLPARGLLGLNFFSHFNLHLRFLDKVMEITK